MQQVQTIFFFIMLNLLVSKSYVGFFFLTFSKSFFFEFCKMYVCNVQEQFFFAILKKLVLCEFQKKNPNFEEKKAENLDLSDDEIKKNFHMYPLCQKREKKMIFKRYILWKYVERAKVQSNGKKKFCHFFCPLWQKK